ncbi:hypothetical protein ACWGE0_31745 [Lentzea sp. NPDC054927]
MPEVEWPPPWFKEFPPAWMRDDVEYVLRKVVEGRLYTDRANEMEYGWVLEDSEPARPIGGDLSEATWIMQERGYLVWGAVASLTNEDGQIFSAECLDLTPSGRELHYKLNQGK